MSSQSALAFDGLSSQDLAALRLSSQVLAHRAALAGLPRVEMFFERLQAEADAEIAARAQLGSRAEGVGDPWQAGGLTGDDQVTIVDYLELLAGNDALATELRGFVRGLIAAQPLS